MTYMTGQQIYENFANAPGTGGLESARAQLFAVRKEYDDLATEIAKAAGALEEYWEGDAAGAAQRGAGPLSLVHKQASAEMNIADQLLDNQISEFNVTKNSVKPVPPAPELPSGIKEVLFGAPPSYLLATMAANDAARHNVAMMDNWTKASHDNGVRMPVSYGKIDPGVFNVTRGPESEKPGAIGGFPGTPAKRKGTGKVSEPPMSGTPAPEPSAPPPAKSTMDQPRPTVPVCGDSDDEYTKPERNTASPKPEPALDTPRTPTTPPPSGSNQTWLPPGTPITRPGVPVSGRTGGPGTSRIGAPVTGGGNAGGRLSGGQGSGVAGPRGLNEAGVRGTGGSAGKAGAGGMAPGVVGQRGKGGEDEDHQRKYVLDDDSHFQPTEKGEKIVDPATGMPPAQPVIGK